VSVVKDDVQNICLRTQISLYNVRQAHCTGGIDLEKGHRTRIVVYFNKQIIPEAQLPSARSPLLD
jgi:hypothetical protein